MEIRMLLHAPKACTSSSSNSKPSSGKRKVGHPHPKEVRPDLEASYHIQRALEGPPATPSRGLLGSAQKGHGSSKTESPNFLEREGIEPASLCRDQHALTRGGGLTHSPAARHSISSASTTVQQSWAQSAHASCMPSSEPLARTSNHSSTMPELTGIPLASPAASDRCGSQGEQAALQSQWGKERCTSSSSAGGQGSGTGGDRGLPVGGDVVQGLRSRGTAPGSGPRGPASSGGLTGDGEHSSLPSTDFDSTQSTNGRHYGLPGEGLRADRTPLGVQGAPAVPAVAIFRVTSLEPQVDFESAVQLLRDAITAHVQRYSCYASGLLRFEVGLPQWGLRLEMAAKPTLSHGRTARRGCISPLAARLLRHSGGCCCCCCLCWFGCSFRAGAAWMWKGAPGEALGTATVSEMQAFFVPRYPAGKGGGRGEVRFRPSSRPRVGTFWLLFLCPAPGHDGGGGGREPAGMHAGLAQSHGRDRHRVPKPRGGSCGCFAGYCRCGTPSARHLSPACRWRGRACNTLPPKKRWGKCWRKWCLRWVPQVPRGALHHCTTWTPRWPTPSSHQWADWPGRAPGCPPPSTSGGGRWRERWGGN
eukprot:jgi/Botrbrau1/13490/Bobra.0082s0086.1